LRELSKKYLPIKISKQPKRGFEIPLQQWVETRLKNVIQGYLSPDSAYVKTILSKDFVSILLNKPSSFNPEKRAKILFALLSVEIWKTGLAK
jgi:asparagine synthase (glutamine-hydrolysing)